jgi:thiol-disulfide isomerase/thioredoxin
MTIDRVIHLYYDEYVKATHDVKGDPAMIVFYATWCRWCQKFMPIYNEASALSNIRFLAIEDFPKDGDGIPTIRGLRDDGVIVEYTGARDTASLLEFAQKLADNTAT